MKSLRGSHGGPCVITLEEENPSLWIRGYGERKRANDEETCSEEKISHLNQVGTIRWREGKRRERRKRKKRKERRKKEE